MTVRSIVGRPLKALFSIAGYDIRRKRTVAFTVEGALARARARGVDVSTIVDIGASNGVWSERALAFWPRAYALLIEANAHHGPGLRSFKERHRASDYVLAAAGDLVGEVFFDGRDPLSGTASHERVGDGYEPVKATTVDHEVEVRGLKPPFLLKFDTHGFEVPILAGAQATLKQTSLIAMEVYNFRLASGALRFHEMCAHLEQIGFRPIDLMATLLRPKDGALWQMDLVFAPVSSAVFLSDEYD